MARQSCTSPMDWARIWTNTVEKETAVQRHAGNFDAGVMSKRLATRDSLDTFMQKTKKAAPPDKYVRPVASSHEYGWEPLPKVHANPRFGRARHGRRLCDVTIYGQSYMEMTGHSPHDAAVGITKRRE